MPPPFIRATLEGVGGPPVLPNKGRPKLINNDAADAATLVKTINTQLMQPLYGRVEALEKQAFIEIQVTTPTPYTGLFPLSLPAPAFIVKALHLAYIRDNTNNGAAVATISPPQWEYRTSGALVLTRLTTLSDATNYTLRFEARG